LAPFVISLFSPSRAEPTAPRERGLTAAPEGNVDSALLSIVLLIALLVVIDRAMRR
jgi:hypothetical protein